MAAVAIDDDMHKKLKVFCVKNGLKIKNVVNALIKEFLENGGKNTIPLFISDDVHLKLKKFCVEKRIKMKEFVDRAIMEALKKEGVE